jgi:alpha-maltose-1-phosphate synthase
VIIKRWPERPPSLRLMQDEQLHRTMGEAARQRMVKLFNYKLVAQKFVEIISRRLSIS